MVEYMTNIEDCQAEGFFRCELQIVIDLLEFLNFIIAPDIGFHHTDGGQVFLNDAVYHVDGALHHTVQGAHMADDEKQQHTQNRGSHQKHQCQLRIDVKGSGHGGEHHDR